MGLAILITEPGTLPDPARMAALAATCASVRQICAPRGATPDDLAREIRAAGRCRPDIVVLDRQPVGSARDAADEISREGVSVLVDLRQHGDDANLNGEKHADRQRD